MLTVLLAAIGLVVLLPETMPRRHPRVFHLMPYLAGDSLNAIRRAKTLGFRFIDQNGQTDADGVMWIMHWATLWTGKYRWIATGETARGGSEIRKRFRGNVHQLQTHQVARLRTRRRGGGRPYRADTHIALAAEVGITLCLELKNLAPVETLRYLRSYAEAQRASVILMTLTQGPGGIPGWRERVDHALKAGWNRVAVLPRCPKPHDWDDKYAANVAVWGSWK